MYYVHGAVCETCDSELLVMTRLQTVQSYCKHADVVCACKAPCQHNFCLACFKKWVAQGKKTCPTCRNSFPAKFAANPRINTALTTAIRMAKQGVRDPAKESNFERIKDKDRPDEAFTTDRAVRAGRANAASGRIMVTIPNDHFGPIPPEADPRGLVRVPP